MAHFRLSLREVLCSLVQYSFYSPCTATLLIIEISTHGTIEGNHIVAKFKYLYWVIFHFENLKLTGAQPKQFSSIDNVTIFYGIHLVQIATLMGSVGLA